MTDIVTQNYLHVLVIVNLSDSSIFEVIFSCADEQLSSTTARDLKKRTHEGITSNRKGKEQLIIQLKLVMTPQLQTLMYWTEVFVTEWNRRKLETRDSIRLATVQTKLQSNTAL